jgi:hypothetical protein
MIALRRSNPTPFARRRDETLVTFSPILVPTTPSRGRRIPRFESAFRVFEKDSSSPRPHRSRRLFEEEFQRLSLLATLKERIWFLIN